MRGAVWSPDSKSVAYFGMSETATHIYIADIATGVSKQMTTTPVLATLVSNFDFTSDGKQIAAVLVPDNRPAMPPAEATIPTGPEVKVALGGRSSLRTFPSLMHNPHDFALLEWHATGQVAIIDVATRAVKKVGTPAMIRAIDRLAERPVRSRHAHDQAVLLHRAGLELRADRRNLGHDGQGARQDHRAADQPRRDSRRPDSIRTPARLAAAAAAAAARTRRASASWRGRRMARA